MSVRKTATCFLLLVFLTALPACISSAQKAKVADAAAVSKEYQKRLPSTTPDQDKDFIKASDALFQSVNEAVNGK